MITVTALPQLRAVRSGLASPLGLVPTMGFLHEGHLSLVRRARAECASVAVSIFVNPAQFNSEQDLETYPRDPERDLEMLEAEGVDLVWTPTSEEVYPDGFQTWVDVLDVSTPLEGANRPGHFRGVATVVAKLFNSFMPQKAYFGQKDAQQVVVVRRMVRDLNFPLDIVVCPTVRETDGLAMSSRNARLNPEQRRVSVVLYQALEAATKTFDTGQRQAGILCRIVAEMIGAEPLAELEYVAVSHPETLQNLDTVTGRALLSLAAYFGQIRLIDNVILGDGPAMNPFV